MSAVTITAGRLELAQRIQDDQATANAIEVIGAALIEEDQREEALELFNM